MKLKNGIWRREDGFILNPFRSSLTRYFEEISKDSPYAFYSLSDGAAYIGNWISSNPNTMYTGGPTTSTGTTGPVLYNGEKKFSNFSGTFRYYRQLGATTSWHVTTAVTLESWIYRTTNDDNWRCCGISVAVNNGFHYAMLTYPQSTYGRKIALEVDDCSAGWSPNVCLSTGEYSLNTWTHVVGTYDGVAGRMAVYFNGVLVGEKTTGVLATIANSVSVTPQIGHHYDVGTSQSFTGSMCCVAMYKSALSAQRVSDHYNAALIGP